MVGNSLQGKSGEAKDSDTCGGGTISETDQGWVKLGLFAKGTTQPSSIGTKGGGGKPYHVTARGRLLFFPTAEDKRTHE